MFALLLHWINPCQKFPAGLRLSELSSAITSDGICSPCVGWGDLGLSWCSVGDWHGLFALKAPSSPGQTWWTFPCVMLLPTKSLVFFVL